MKTFKVRETFIAKGWTYVKAANEEEAVKILEAGGGDFQEDDFDHKDTKWESLTEVPVD